VAYEWDFRLSADGDSVDAQVFDNFSRIANAHANDSPSSRQAQNVTNAFIVLGRYDLNGIPNKNERIRHGRGTYSRTPHPISAMRICIPRQLFATCCQSKGRQSYITNLNVYAAHRARHM